MKFLFEIKTEHFTAGIIGVSSSIAIAIIATQTTVSGIALPAILSTAASTVIIIHHILPTRQTVKRSAAATTVAN
jgi:hypothetical protein